MIRSMYAAVSGLRGHQEMINVTGNNIANVNTTGFKKSSVMFQDILGQTLSGATAPAAELGGTNPAQVGLGVRVSGVAQNLGQGALNRTGRVLDLAIEGDGFFVLNQMGQNLFTRSGSFFLDADGRMVSSQGGLVQGWGEVNGVVDTARPVGPIRVPMGDQIQPKATSEVTVGGNLPADAATGHQVRTGLNIYDAQGRAQSVEITFTKLAGANAWEIGGAGLTVTGSNQLTFNADGTLDPTSMSFQVNAGGADFTVALGDAVTAPRQVTQFAGSPAMSVLNQDGAATGTLQSLSIGQDGVIFGAYSNGQNQPIGQLALATFANPEGLERLAGTNFRASPNSGLAQIGTLGSGGRGLLHGGTLEGSNVDLAEEFTELIRGQRGFQANSRVITTSDEVLQELVNLKR